MDTFSYLPIGCIVELLFEKTKNKARTLKVVRYRRIQWRMGFVFRLCLLASIFCSARSLSYILSSMRTDIEGSGCGSVVRVVAYYTRGPQFESSHRLNFIHIFIINCTEKTKINKKRPTMAHFLKNWNLVSLERLVRLFSYSALSEETLIVMEKLWLLFLGQGTLKRDQSK